MRKLSFVLLAVVAGAAALASACDEHFPDPISEPSPRVADGGALESALPAIVAPSKRHDNVSSPVIFDAERGRIWTANGDVGSISYVDVDARKVVQEIAIGKDVRSVALSADARWLAAVDRDGASVTLVDAESRTVRRTIALGTHPRAAVWDSANPRWLYVAVEDDDAVVIVDRVLGAVIKTIAVGRLPSGLAVSRARRELYVTHRIDGKVSVVDLKEWAVSTDVVLASQPSDPDKTRPQGRPFAFEGLAWAADGNVAWLPHELLASTQPFAFQKTLFPSISVVDLSDAKSEVVTADPASGVFEGRKNLFGAMNVLDATGNATIFSQPCAAALHPNGLVGYVVACGSEDLVVFDAAAGIATEVLRNLPGDHPTGIALDDTGQRAWILSDQSHTLEMVDLAGGNPTKHVKLAAEPIALVAKDPIDVDTREGLKLWFRANSAKGDFATTGNNWMSCAGCHLDGLASTNQVFFEALKIDDPKSDAQIGHVGLHDLFSTAPTPGDPIFAPNDVLIALLDQGGLAPDRTGAKRDGQIDPKKPSAAAAKMAFWIAKVIARDLPVGPSWLLSPGDKPNVDYDGQWCGNCHKPEYDAWSKSAHAHSAEDPMVLFGMGVEVAKRGPQYSRQCAGCHDLTSVRVGDTTFAKKRGITCLGCHDTVRLINAGGNSDMEQRSHAWDKDHKAWGKTSLERLRKPEFCGGCHQQFVPGTGMPAIGTLTEFLASPFAGVGAGAGATKCVDCHMTVSNGVADHRVPGGNVYMGQKFGDAALVDDQKKMLKRAIDLRAKRAGGGAMVFVRNKGAGHAFPTGVSDVREPWVEVQAVDAQKRVLARFGGPDANNLIPLTAGRLGMDIAKPDGTLLFQHELSEATRIPFELRVAAQSTEAIFVKVPAALPAGTDHLEAVLLYRNVRTPYFRAATGDATATAPEVEVARVSVE